MSLFRSSFSGALSKVGEVFHPRAPLALYSSPLSERRPHSGQEDRRRPGVSSRKGSKTGNRVLAKHWVIWGSRQGSPSDVEVPPPPCAAHMPGSPSFLGLPDTHSSRSLSAGAPSASWTPAAPQQRQALPRVLAAGCGDCGSQAFSPVTCSSPEGGGREAPRPCTVQHRAACSWQTSSIKCLHVHGPQTRSQAVPAAVP